MFEGQLRRLTGKGFSGTFQLVDGANKTGGKFEDAIENAIISMNEPKEVSVTGLRDYLSECIEKKFTLFISCDIKNEYPMLKAIYYDNALP